jgi:undecaprenyl-diphosphatase
MQRRTGRLPGRRSPQRPVPRAGTRHARAGTRPPTALSRLAGPGTLWLAGAAGLAAVGEHRAAAQGLAAVAMSSPLATLARRRRPTGADSGRAESARVGPRAPRPSRPSGHTAAAFAFTAAAGGGLGMPLTVPLAGTAALAVGLGRRATAGRRPGEVAAAAALGLLGAAGSGSLVRRFAPEPGVPPRRDPRRDYAYAGYRHAKAGRRDWKLPTPGELPTPGKLPTPGSHEG